MMTYDVVVVGAGPAGSTAARCAARGGARTLLVERRREVGTPVQCGEFLPTVAETARMFPRARGLDDLFQGAASCVRARTRRLHVFSPGGRRYDVPFDGLVLDRGRFDRSLARAAVSAGGEVWTGTRARALAGDCLATERGNVRSRVVIGADGPKSVVAREAGLAPCGHMAFGAQYLCRGVPCDPAVVEMHFGPGASGGYAWVIPKGDGLANVGVGVRLLLRKGGGAAVRRRLDSFIATLEGRSGSRIERLRFTAGLIPVGGPRHRTVVGNVLLAGDAAGHLMPCNGGGIPTAVICGRIAGEVAAAHVRDGTPLSAYETRWREAVGRELAHAVTTRRVFDVVTHSRAATELAMSVAGSHGIRELLTCRPWYRAGIQI